MNRQTQATYSVSPTQLPVLWRLKLSQECRTYAAKARLRCKACQRQFVAVRGHPPLSNECKRRIEVLLVERISLEGICPGGEPRGMEIKAHQRDAYLEEL